MVMPGDVVVAIYPGIKSTKKRPSVVVSTDLYHSTRPDVVLCVLTTQIPRALAPTDYLLQDWAAAGLHRSSLFRAFFNTRMAADLPVIGHLSDRDWSEVQARLRIALAVT